MGSPHAKTGGLTHTQRHACTHTQTCIHMHTYIHKGMHEHTHIHIHIHVPTVYTLTCIHTANLKEKNREEER